MFDDFLVRAALAGVGIGFVAGPLGCFVVWRRMAYFGDATAHAAILGVALSLAFSVSILVGVLISAGGVALAMMLLSGRFISADTILGVIAHGALALGLVAVALTGDVSLNLESYLFGEILAVTRWDMAVIWIGAVVVLALLAWRWSALLTSTLSPDLAFSSGIKPERERFVLTLALAIVVAVGLKVVGALLITAMLIIPAAAARPVSRSPEMMALVAAVIGIASSLGGLRLSYVYDTPTAPTMVVVAIGFFLGSNLVRLIRRA
ncbi:metal ABC transporter permease [Rhodobacteraceae bacterium NNCM2]|nr:metal ABC transporter permease [Coraliihabitans acroporae]